MKMLRITLEGKSYEVGVEVLDAASTTPSSAPAFAVPPAAAPQPPSTAPRVAPASSASGGGKLVVSPMAGLVFKCLVKPGDIVSLNQVVIVLDAMKMETPIHASVAGTVCAVMVKQGDAVEEGTGLLQIDGDPQ
ncbi:MAG: biotin/lipoyl-binding protein [Desulfuromonadaceae bacterium]|nr:biotin/lipoyl-binding protein [Desulfuromonadaceae bacterium]MDD5106703.1 biotin/lipoyl-binding protein [Desulfuromonadaceae bacterium]